MSVKSLPPPFTQKPELGAFQPCSPYLWYEIQILDGEGEKHKADAGWGYRAATFFPWQLREHVTLLLPLSHLARSLLFVALDTHSIDTRTHTHRDVYTYNQL